jgi:hypothetical protein
VPRLENRFLHRRILLVDPRPRRVREIRVFREVHDVHEPLAAFPVQRRTLPDAVLREELDDVRFTRHVVLVEKRRQTLVGGSVPACTVFARDERIFVRRARFEDPDQVLERALPFATASEARMASGT